MTRLLVILQCTILLTASFGAQQPESKKMPQKPHKATPAATDSAEMRGMRMLEAAEVDARALEGGMAAFALLQVGRGYARSGGDRQKAIELLELALASTVPIEDENYGGMGQRARMHVYIMRELVNLAPDRVDELMPQIEPEARDKVLASLLTYYEAHKQLERAIEVLYRISAEKEMPYDVAARLMAALPPDRNSDLLQIFTTALASYRDHTEHENVGDFSSLILQFRDKLPQQTVRDAIDTVFSQAEQALKDSEGPPVAVAMSTSKGSVSFKSHYELRLFQLLPILRELDSAAAEKLLKQHPAVAIELERYPLGMASLQMPQATAVEKRADDGKAAVWRIRPTRANLADRMTEMSKAHEITSNAEQHPGDALANVTTIADPTIRCYALEGIARAALRKDRAIAKSAARKLVDSIETAEGVDIQLMLLRSAIDLFTRVDDRESAKTTLQHGFALAERAYKQDSNADQPNRAYKAFWPSTAAYRWFCGQAAEMSPEWALDEMTKISDTELRVLAEIEMANTMLKLPQGTTPIITANKSRAELLTVE